MRARPGLRPESGRVRTQPGDRGPATRPCPVARAVVGRHMHRQSLAWVLLVLAAFASGYRSQAAGYSEVALKAVYLHRFAAYVDWPSTGAPPDSFMIGVVGPGPVIEEMRRATASLTVDARRVLTRSVQDPPDLDGLRILYVSPGYLTSARTLISSIETPILIVTDEPLGLTRGGIINFVRVGANVRFEASIVAARERGLRLRSGLLSIAIRVVGQSVRDCCAVAIDTDARIAASQCDLGGELRAAAGAAAPITRRPLAADGGTAREFGVHAGC